MRVFDSTGLKMLAAATMTLAAGMAMPMFAPAQATPEMKVAMAMPMPHRGKMVRHDMRSMRHHAAKGDDRYGMK